MELNFRRGNRKRTSRTTKSEKIYELREDFTHSLSKLITSVRFIIWFKGPPLPITLEKLKTAECVIIK